VSLQQRCFDVRVRGALSSTFVSHAAPGLHFLHLDRSLHAVGGQEVVARLGRRGGEQCAYLPDWHEDGAVWFCPSKSLLHRAVLIQSPVVEKIAANYLKQTEVPDKSPYHSLTRLAPLFSLRFNGQEVPDQAF